MWSTQLVSLPVRHSPPCVRRSTRLVRRPPCGPSGHWRDVGSALGVEFAGDPQTAHGGVGDQRQRLPLEVVNHGQHPKAPTPGEHVGNEVQRPALVGGPGVSSSVPGCRWRVFGRACRGLLQDVGKSQAVRGGRPVRGKLSSAPLVFKTTTTSVFSARDSGPSGSGRETR